MKAAFTPACTAMTQTSDQSNSRNGFDVVREKVCMLGVWSGVWDDRAPPREFFSELTPAAMKSSSIVSYWYLLSDEQLEKAVSSQTSEHSSCDSIQSVR
jgi:hypothetical protein